MALRSVLRLLLPSGPRIVPMHGISTAAAPQFIKTGISPAAAARFIKTGSQVEAKTVAEQESIRLSNRHFIHAQNKYDKVFARLEATRQSVAEFSKAVGDFRKVADSSTYVAAAIPLIMIIGRNCQEYLRSIMGS